MRSLTKMTKANPIVLPYLKSGDCIGIVAPARKISVDELSSAISLLESWGLKVKVGKNIYATLNQFAGTDKERTADMQQMLDNIFQLLFAKQYFLAQRQQSVYRRTDVEYYGVPQPYSKAFRNRDTAQHHAYQFQ